MYSRRRLFRTSCCLFGLMLLAGCSVIPEAQPDPTRFYVLTEKANVAGAVQTPADGLRIGLRPVALPAYLDKGALVVRQGEHEVDYRDYARWAEPLAAGIARVLAAQLLSDPAVARVQLHPFPFDQERDCDIAVSIVRCEGVTGDGPPRARFAARVEITTTGEEVHVLARRMFVAPDQPWDGTDHAALVQAFSAAVWGLGDEITAALPMD